jgi:hypothetical protein
MAPIVTRLEEPVERSFERAREKGLQSVIVIGYDRDGAEFFSSSISDGGEAVWLLERIKLQLLRQGD